MPYTPNPRNSAEPLDSEKAKTAAAEFREIKKYITKIPVVEVSANKTLAVEDAGKCQLHPSADVTARAWEIPDNATVPYDVGTVLSFAVQNGAGTITLTIAGTDVMRLLPAGSTGARTLPANSNATALKITATEWQVTGTGIG